MTVDLASGADYQVDVSDGDAVTRAATAIGPVDILINSAGIVGPNKPLWEIDDQGWNSTFAVNTLGTFHWCRAVVPACANVAGDGSSTSPAWPAKTATPICLPIQPARRPSSP